MSPENLKKLKQLQSLGKLLDNAIPIPFTKYKIGLDPIIGLFPAVGDYLTLFISGYIVYQSAKLGAKQETLVKMATNILIDSLVGTVPVAGDLFDVAWKSNQMNLALLEKELPTPQNGENLSNSEESIDWKPILLIFVAIALLIALSTAIFLWLLNIIFGAIT